MAGGTNVPREAAHDKWKSFSRGVEKLDVCPPVTALLVQECTNDEERDMETQLLHRLLMSLSTLADLLVYVSIYCHDGYPSVLEFELTSANSDHLPQRH